MLASAGIEQSIISFNAPTTASIIAGLVAICSLCVSAFVSASEIAYFSLKDTDFEKFESQRTLDMVKKLLANPEKLLATILISNNLVNVTIIILCNFVMNQVLEVRSSVLDFIIQSVFLTFLILLFGEIIPKIYSSNNNIRFASFAANGLTFLSKLFNPISRIMVKSTIIVNKVVTKRADDISMDDLSQALELSEVNSENEKELLEGILTFGDKTVAEIMRPRVDVVDIDFKADFDEVVKIVVENGYSRMPVYEDNNDNIKGVLYAKDLLPYIGKRSKDFNWTTLLRQAYFVPETREIGDLLEDFRKTKVHMAIIVDEFGCTQGIVTLEDILEEIVGDINDEYDTDEDNSYKKINDNTYIFEGKTLINDFYKITDIEEDAFEEIEDDAETIAGLILNLKGDFPKEKETIEYGRFQFQVLKVSKHRIVSVKVKIN
ncbi:MAG: gliding motility-associated protein GldE [Muribaculaceae bacterium]|nr:gliding motility-associated protein GldE [Muribaculaceae bacterium]